MGNLTSALKNVISSIEEADVPEQYKQFAFQECLKAELKINMMNYSNIIPGQDKAVTRDALEESDNESNNWTRFSEKVGVQVKILQDYYSIDEDGSVRLTLSSKQLPSEKSKATQIIALLLAAANEMLVCENKETTYKQVRLVCENYDRLDSPNFSKSLGRFDRFIKIIGKGKTSSFTLKQTGWEKVAEILQSIEP